MRLFDQLTIETQSDCNRTCNTCLRQSHPDGPRNGRAQMPTEMVFDLIDQGAALIPHGWLCLQFFNEPLLDERLPKFAAYARGKYREVMVNTNGDYLSPEVAEQLDGTVDRLHVALYGGNKAGREASIRERFGQTRLTFTDGQHYITHYSPFTNLQEAIDECCVQPCVREVQLRMIVSYSGEMLMCCEDIAGEWDLGSAAQQPLQELWFSPEHRAALEELSQPGGRRHWYCQICPRPYRPYP